MDDMLNERFGGVPLEVSGPSEAIGTVLGRDSEAAGSRAMNESREFSGPASPEAAETHRRDDTGTACRTRSGPGGTGSSPTEPFGRDAHLRGVR